MKLYYHPISTTSRPVMLFAAESGIALDMQVVDLFTGEHFQAPYEAINPNHLIPVLEDGDFRLTEKLRHIEISRRQDQFSGLPQRPATARASQRAHGLD